MLLVFEKLPDSLEQVVVSQPALPVNIDECCAVYLYLYWY